MTALKKMLDNYKIIQDKLEAEKKILTEMLRPQIEQWLENEGIDTKDAVTSGWYIRWIFPNEDKVIILVHNEDRCIWGTEFEIYIDLGE